ncbi:MAG: biotin transporter BioY, partial [Cyanobacteria bacterium J06626_14]
MTTRDLVYIAVFAALVAALGLIPPIPLPFIPVPITAQSLGVMLAGAILGARRGACALLLFLVLVAIGFPLLSGGR